MSKNTLLKRSNKSSLKRKSKGGVNSKFQLVCFCMLCEQERPLETITLECFYRMERPKDFVYFTGDFNSGEPVERSERYNVGSR